MRDLSVIYEVEVLKFRVCCTGMRRLFLAAYTILSLAYMATVVAQPEEHLIQCDLISLYHMTMSTSPTIRRQQIQYQQSIADRRGAKGIFDYQLYSDLTVSRSAVNLFDVDPRIDIVGNQIRTNNLALAAGVQRTFRSGLRATAGIEYSRVADNYPFNAFNEKVGSFLSDNITSFNFSLSQPLLKGREKNIVASGEEVADINIESQKHNEAFVTSGQALNMAIGYWQYLGAIKSLEIYRSNEIRVRKVLEITEALVKAEKKPSSDLIQIRADIKDKERQTILADQQLYAAKQNLGRQIGLTATQSEQIGHPLNDFPKLGDLGKNSTLDALINVARRNREDLKALKKSLNIFDIYLDIAENNTRPQIDISTFLRYSGTDNGNNIYKFFSAIGKEEGRNYQVGFGFNYQFPINNNRAKAELMSNKLQYSDQEILIADQIRNMELNVSIAYNNFVNSIKALKKSKQSLTYYQEVFENEKFKFQSGLTTLLNLILLQERLTFAELEYIQNQIQFAISISNLRYETGTNSLPNQSIGKDRKLVNTDVFYTLPME